MRLASSAKLDGYEILGLLGAGGMGEVYLDPSPCKEERNGRPRSHERALPVEQQETYFARASVLGAKPTFVGRAQFH